jgi:hypothetical protein
MKQLCPRLEMVPLVAMMLPRVPIAHDPTIFHRHRLGHSIIHPPHPPAAATATTIPVEWTILVRMLMTRSTIPCRSSNASARTSVAGNIGTLPCPNQDKVLLNYCSDCWLFTFPLAVVLAWRAWEVEVVTTIVPGHRRRLTGRIMSMVNTSTAGAIAHIVAIRLLPATHTTTRTIVANDGSSRRNDHRDTKHITTTNLLLVALLLLLLRHTTAIVDIMMMRIRRRIIVVALTTARIDPPTIGMVVVGTACTVVTIRYRGGSYSWWRSSHTWPVVTASIYCRCCCSALALVGLAEASFTVAAVDWAAGIIDGGACGSRCWC